MIIRRLRAKNMMQQENNIIFVLKLPHIIPESWKRPPD